jgi:cytochrome b
MVILFFILISTQLLTGLMSSDGILTDGPLVEYVSSDTVDFANWLHHLNFDILLYAIGLHVLAIIVYKFKGKPLVKSMITGTKELSNENAQVKLTKSSWPAWVIFLGLLAVLAFSWAKEPLNYLFS